MEKELIENAKNNSICNKKEKFVVKKKTIKKSLFILCVAIIITLTTTACVSQKNDSIEQTSSPISSSQETDYVPIVDYNYDAYVASINRQVESYLFINSMDFSREYTVDDYKNIKQLKESDLIGYYNLLGKTESEKVVQALGYKDWNDYLVSNGYIKDGQPSFSAWKLQLQKDYNARESEAKTR